MLKVGCMLANRGNEGRGFCFGGKGEEGNFTNRGERKGIFHLKEKGKVGLLPNGEEEVVEGVGAFFLNREGEGGGRCPNGGS